MKSYKYYSFDISDDDFSTMKKSNAILFKESRDTQLILKEDDQKTNYCIHWRSNELQNLIELFEEIKSELANIKINRVITTFAYPELIPQLLDLKFILKSYYRDFWIKSLETIKIPQIDKNIRLFTNDDAQTLSDISTACTYSEGWIKAGPKFFIYWNNSSKSIIFIATHSNKITGYLCASLYGTDNNITLWVRELAVDPEYQNKGYGKALIFKALEWGKNNGAVKSFLATDIRTKNFEHIYDPIGYKLNEDDPGEINMFLINRYTTKTIKEISNYE